MEKDSDQLDDQHPLPQADCDWLLRFIVHHFGNNAGIEIGVILHVGGGIIAGQMISGIRYFELLGQQFGQGVAFDPELSKTFETAIQGFGALYGKPTIDAEGAEIKAPPLEERNVAFIHLKNARFYAPNGDAIPSAPGTLWRGRLSEVSGFSMGAFERA